MLIVSLERLQRRKGKYGTILLARAGIRGQMALSPRLEIRQSQSLTLTPQLVQSIKLLQLSHLELAGFVEEELLCNPLIEREETSERAITETPDIAKESGEATMAEPQEADLETLGIKDAVDVGAQMQSATQIAETLDTDATILFPEQVGQDSVRASTQLPGERSLLANGEAADIDQYVSAQITLRDHLSEQVCFLLDDPGERLIARNLIDNLDDTGYLTSSCEAIAEQLGTVRQDVEDVLSRIQSCEPVGVFARDVRECLALQLREKDRLDPLMATLLENLDLVANHDFDALRRVVGASDSDLRDMLSEIRQLDPRPGRAFDGAPIQAIVADVFVREDVDGGWEVELNSDILPKVLINRTYFASVSKRARDKQEKAFLVDCLQQATWLTKSLDQRAQTILKTATEIVRVQDEFLVHGVSRLKPMTLKMVADAVEMHESTISRVTSNKYISTPRGLFEMKYFFTTALASTSGTDEHSAESVRFLIKQMIGEESHKAILSDDTIAARLRENEGVDVARRTVAKYREGMHIPSSVVRRRQKKALHAAK